MENGSLWAMRFGGNPHDMKTCGESPNSLCSNWSVEIAVYSIWSMIGIGSYQCAVWLVYSTYSLLRLVRSNWGSRNGLAFWYNPADVSGGKPKWYHQGIWRKSENWKIRENPEVPGERGTWISGSLRTWGPGCFATWTHLEILRPESMEIWISGGSWSLEIIIHQETRPDFQI